MENEDSEVVFIALEALYQLSLSIEDRPRMASILGLVSSVKALMLSHSANAESKKMATNVYANLQTHLDGVTTSTSHFGRENNAQQPAAGLSFFSSSVTNCLSKTETFTFYMNNLTSEEERTATEAKLLKIRGIIPRFDLMEQGLSHFC